MKASTLNPFCETFHASSFPSRAGALAMATVHFATATANPVKLHIAYVAEKDKPFALRLSGRLHFRTKHAHSGRCMS